MKQTVLIVRFQVSDFLFYYQNIFFQFIYDLKGKLTYIFLSIFILNFAKRMIGQQLIWHRNFLIIFITCHVPEIGPPPFSMEKFWLNVLERTFH